MVSACIDADVSSRNRCRNDQRNDLHSCWRHSEWRNGPKKRQSGFHVEVDKRLMPTLTSLAVRIRVRFAAVPSVPLPFLYHSCITISQNRPESRQSHANSEGRKR